MKSKNKFSIAHVYTATFEKRPTIVGYGTVVHLSVPVEKDRFVQLLRTNLGKLGLKLVRHTHIRLPGTEGKLLTATFTVELTAEIEADTAPAPSSALEQELANQTADGKRAFGAGIVYAALYFTLEELTR